MWVPDARIITFDSNILKLFCGWFLGRWFLWGKWDWGCSRPSCVSHFQLTQFTWDWAHDFERVFLSDFWNSFVCACNIFFYTDPTIRCLRKQKNYIICSSSEKEGFRISETSQWFPPKHENPSHEWWWWRRGTSYSRNTPTLSTFLSLSLSSSHRTILHKRLSLLLTCTPRILGRDDQIAQRTRRVLKYRNKSL